MQKIPKSTTLYPHPFSKDYWHDAAMELRDTKMLVIAALMIALRVSMKWTVIPLAPNLNINVGAPLINAMGAMIFGPVVAALAACVSDLLGFLLFPQGGVYFLPYMFVEVAGSVLFALFFYRAKVTVTRVILARFSMDLFVNIILNSLVSMWYYAAILGKSYAFMILPAVIKNLCLFPIESFLLTLFLGVVIPVTRRMKLTYAPPKETEKPKGGSLTKKSHVAEELKFDKKQLILLLTLFAVGVCCVVGYLAYYYDHNSISGSYTAEERYEINTRMTQVVQEQSDEYDDDTLVTTVESAYEKFLGDTTTYNVAVYVVDTGALDGYGKDLEAIRGLSKSKAKAVADDGVMTRAAEAVVVLNKDTGEIVSFEMQSYGN
ncbi:MAG: hypothetical protein SOW84_03675 [Candidatus Faecousia sp.]|nr:hypothetical protein [Candidatus Faecousia sp.]